MAPRINYKDQAAVRRLLADGRLDAAESVFFLRQLEQQLAESFDTKYIENKALQFLPVDTSIEPAAESVRWESFSHSGAAKLLASPGDDVPRVNVTGQEFFQGLKSYTLGYEYSVDEIRAAAMANRPLESDRAMAVRRGLANKLDDVAFSGDSAAGLTGFNGLSNVHTYSTPDGAGGDKQWSLKTADEILADMNGMCNQVLTATGEVERVTRLLLPTSNYTLISTRARSTTSDTTILRFFQLNRPEVEVMSWERLETAIAAGGDSTRRMIGYRPDRMALRFLLPIAFEQQAPQLHNWSYRVNCRVKTGGVINPYPKSVIYGDQI